MIVETRLSLQGSMFHHSLAHRRHKDVEVRSVGLALSLRTCFDAGNSKDLTLKAINKAFQMSSKGSQTPFPRLMANNDNFSYLGGLGLTNLFSVCVCALVCV